MFTSTQSLLARDSGKQNPPGGTATIACPIDASCVQGKVRYHHRLSSANPPTPVAEHLVVQEKPTGGRGNCALNIDSLPQNTNKCLLLPLSNATLHKIIKIILAFRLLPLVDGAAGAR